MFITLILFVLPHSLFTNMILDDLYAIAREDGEIIRFLRDNGVIKSQMICPDCNVQMYTDVNLKLFRCQKASYIINAHRKRERIYCNRSFSIYSDSWMANFKSNLKKIFTIIFTYIHQDIVTLEYLAEESMSTITTVRRVIKIIKITLDLWVTGNNSDKIGGRNVVVEVDELCWGGRKLRLGRPVSPKQWVLGLRERISGRLVVVQVPDRKAETLILLIEKYVKRGSVINSDCWSGYVSLTLRGYYHKRVNHRLYHINRVNRAHIQTMERTWRELRRLVPKYGRSVGGVASRLSKFAFTYSTPRPDRVLNFFRILANYYGPE